MGGSNGGSEDFGEETKPYHCFISMMFNITFNNNDFIVSVKTCTVIFFNFNLHIQVV